MIKDPSRFIKIFINHNSNNKNFDPNLKNRISKICTVAKQHGISLQEVKDPKTLDQWFEEKINHQGIVAQITPTKFLVEKDLLEIVENYNNQNKKVVFMVLDHIQDPRNLGACIRNAAAFGVDAIIVSKDRSCDFTATVRKVASGAVDLVPIARVDNLSSILQQLQKLGVWTVALAAGHNQALSDLDLTIHIALILGSDDRGVKDLIKRNSDFLAKIPMQNAIIDSLNVSVAAGICLYEVYKQRNN